jgi:hypothetical protein
MSLLKKAGGFAASEIVPQPVLFSMFHFLTNVMSYGTIEGR